jgi:hypothetical protein
MKDFHIMSYNEITGTNALEDYLLSHLKGVEKQITEKEFLLLQACKGNIKDGIFTLSNLQAKIDKYKSDLE